MESISVVMVQMNLFLAVSFPTPAPQQLFPKCHFMGTKGLYRIMFCCRPQGTWYNVSVLVVKEECPGNSEEPLNEQGWLHSFVGNNYPCSLLSFSDHDCLRSNLGEFYMGNQNYTENGHACKPWSEADFSQRLYLNLMILNSLCIY